MSQFWKPGAEKPRLLDDEEGGVVFFPTSSGGGYANLERQRQRLPVFRYRTAILYSVETRATTVVVGETGSGKTTQIPQYLKEAGWADGGRVIACTQPRRLAVQSVAARVAEEMGVKLGEEVGYTIRFEDATTQGVTMIKFLTDGVLLREMMDDPLLTKYSVVMVDEAHERSISTDILLGLLKKIQKRRPELRLIISSATIQAKSMAAFFQSSRKRRRRPEGEELGPIMEPAVLSVEGRGFNVQIHYVEEPVADYLRAAVSTVLLIHDQEPMGDILVFLTGQDDIDAAVQLITEETQNRRKNSSGLMVLPLYSGLPRADQELVFSPTPRGKRKVVISTNIAETSITLEGVVYVVDSGFSKQRFYNPISDIENLVVAPISKASARQRTGRAGRVRPGKCYRLYTEEYFVKEMSAEGIPEIQRSNLVSCVIQGDHVSFLNVYKAFLQSGKSSQWCHKNFVNYQAMKKVLEIREQLRRTARRLGIDLKSCERDTVVVRKAITYGFFANACVSEASSHDGKYKTIRGSQEVYIHPSSVLFRVNPKWVVYHSLVSTEKQYMRNVISIDPSWLTEAAPHFYQKQRPNPMLH
ncbi:probable pre-mRNA-splicing factor ATP-dependent RNA helicase DEAH9 isoform X2 [Rosa chinensis]|uniref:probable pre-mRNA-splicing factor ATP-dependent RNA helicase DEAH9 isoform X2 n=1 Tax=Rosa chinensis TaxID=74649 RepID=UPI000D08EB0B|nr:probable pre-mRNA-splicing factor ATP-dependent RNA helicase DEAH9 isoform X2 [Rosa chinensis]